MYELHPVFEPPRDQDTRIWRYMDFTKFVSLLDRNAIFFVKSNILDDPYEGAIPRRTFRAWSRWFPEDPELKHVRTICSSLAVSSWHMNKGESAAMWQMYIKGNEGIAITSTFDRLARSFDRATRPQYIGMVQYIDYNRDRIRQERANTLSFVMYKRCSFEFERELRAVVSCLALLDEQQRQTINVTQQHIDRDLHHNDVVTATGIYVPVDLDVLIDQIYVSPTAQGWFVELVRSVTLRYCLEKDIHQSSLADPPVY